MPIPQDDLKISQLTAAAALTGAEIVPVDQSGVTKRTTAAAMLNQPTQSLTVVGITSGSIVMDGILFIGTAGAANPQIFVNDTNSNQVYFLTAATRVARHFGRDDNTTYVSMEVRGTGGPNLGQYKISGALQATQGFGVNGASPQAAAAVNAASVDLATVIALCNQLRAALIANGICV
jgi:hypothetical protein